MSTAATRERLPALAVGLAEAVVFGVAGFAALRAHRASRAAGDERAAKVVAAVEAALPGPLAKFLILEVRVLAAAFRAIARRPIRAADSSSSFGGLAPGYPLVVGVLIALSIVELGVAHVVMHALLGAGHATAHAALAAVHVYGMLWLVGDARALAESRHAVDARALHLRFGLRASADVARESIVAARVVHDDIDTKGALRLTAFDPPNVEIVIGPPACATTLFGFRRPASRVVLRVGDPEALVSTLTRN